MLGNKDVMAKNIIRFMHQKDVNATEICKVLGIKNNTFSDWVNAKTYPRIDKIEMMANYFGVSKAALVEDLTEASFSVPEFSPDHIELIRLYSGLTKEQKKSVMSLLRSFYI